MVRITRIITKIARCIPLKAIHLCWRKADELRVPLTFVLDGVTYVKTYTLKRKDYAISVDYTIKNDTSAPLEMAFFGQLKQSVNLPERLNNGSSNFALHTYRGAAYSSEDTNYKNTASVISKINH